jgi:hypothetical protein
MTRRLLLVVLLLPTPTNEAGAQNVSALELRRALDRLATAAAPIPLPRLAEAIRWLRGNQDRADLERLTPEYVRALERIAGMLERRWDAAMIDDITQELEAKVQHCRVLGVGMGGSVALRVNTRRSGAVVPEWQVLYLLKFDEWLKTPPRTFPRVSSPTDASLEPGRYWIWARDPATGTTSERVLVEVVGAPTLLVDIPVP